MFYVFENKIHGYAKILLHSLSVYITNFVILVFTHLLNPKLLD